MSESGAVPATIAILDGHVRISLDDSALDRIATDATVIKSSIRDLGSVLIARALGSPPWASPSSPDRQRQARSARGNAAQQTRQAKNVRATYDACIGV